MKAWAVRRGISKVCLFGGIIAMPGACYAFGLSDEIGNRSVPVKEDSIIGTSQGAAFFAYIERQQMSISGQAFLRRYRLFY
jgi:hypothetical protein